MFRIFIGYDPRQPLSYNVMRHSIERHASSTPLVSPLILKQLPITREGATEFTFSRWLCPYLSGFEGVSVFFDEDQVCIGDVFELELPASDTWSVAVLKAQPRFEWPSVMVFNNARCTMLTPQFIDDTANDLYDWAWVEEDQIGTLPDAWNHCVGYHDPKDAKLYHYTEGIPFWPECRGLPEDRFWFEEYQAMVKSVDWIDLHAHTKHFPNVMQRMLRTKYGLQVKVNQ